MADVPNVSGVPALLSGFSADVFDGAALMVEDAVSSLFGGGQSWGIFLNGSPVITADSVVGFEYKQEWAIADYPLEQGAFQSYDKVQLPFDARVRFSAGGNAANREALLSSIAAIAGDLNLYDVATPEQIYQSVSVRHYDYRRTSVQGNGLLVVDIWMQEVRVTATATFSNSAASNAGGGSSTPSASTTPSSSAAPPSTDGTAAPSGDATAAPSAAAPVDNGVVSPTTPTPANNAQVTNQVGGNSGIYGAPAPGEIVWGP